jgi:hypothetical protein
VRETHASSELEGRDAGAHARDREPRMVEVRHEDERGLRAKIAERHAQIPRGVLREAKLGAIAHEFPHDVCGSVLEKRGRGRAQKITGDPDRTRLERIMRPG